MDDSEKTENTEYTPKDENTGSGTDAQNENGAEAAQTPENETPKANPKPGYDESAEVASAKKSSAFLRRQAREIKNYRVLRRVIPLILACILILLVLIYLIALMYTRFGSFTVSVNKYHQLQYGLSLSESPEFIKPTSRLDCRASEDITNISGKSLDDIDLGAVNGMDSGANYLCYTFYCKNVGKEVLDYDYSINIANMTLGVEKAARVRLIKNRNGENGTTTDYARAAGVDENGNAIPEPGTVPFYSKYIIMQDKVEQFAPGEWCKYTVVIWLEGDDPECVDNIIGGQFKIDMKFTVASTSDVDN